MTRTPVQVELHRGRLEATWTGLATSGPLRPRVVDTSGREHLGTTWRRQDGVFESACGPLSVRLRVRPAGPTVRLELQAVAERQAEIAEIGLQAEPRVSGAAPRWLVSSAYQSWDASGVMPAQPDGDSQLQSWWTAGFADDPGAGLAVTALSARAAMTRFDLRHDLAVITAAEPHGLEAHPLLWSATKGQAWNADTLLISAGNDVFAELRRVAGRVRGRPRNRSRPPQGWLSWYHYGPWVTREDVVANAAALGDGALAGLGYSVVQIDDGWQKLYGDWVTNEKFPDGLDGIARHCAQSGQVLGVWTAPFLVSEVSDLARNAPDDWFIPDPQTGRRAVDPNHVVFGPMNMLDARNPRVRRHLRDTFARLRADGVRYFKIDFLYAGAYAGTGAFREALRAIRQGVGDDAYLLACGSPLLPAVGICDGCRIGRDTATPIFDFELGTPKPTLIDDEIADVARNLAARHHLHRWFELDPDVALVGGNLTLDQARSCVTFCALSGGPFFASDDLKSLPQERLALLTNRAVLDLVGDAPAEPDWDPDGSGHASPIWRSARAIAAFNWSAEARDVDVEISAPGRVRDLWTGEDLGLAESSIRLRVEAQGVRLIRVGEG